MCNQYNEEPMIESSGQVRVGNLRNLTPEETLNIKYEQARENLEHAQTEFELIKWARTIISVAGLTPKSQSLLIRKL